MYKNAYIYSSVCGGVYIYVDLHSPSPYTWRCVNVCIYMYVCVYLHLSVDGIVYVCVLYVYCKCCQSVCSNYLLANN